MPNEASAVGLWLVTPPKWRPWAAIAGTAYGLAVAAGVVVAGWHLVSDVLGAAMVVGFWACVAMAALIQAGLEGRGKAADPDRTNRPPRGPSRTG